VVPTDHAEADDGATQSRLSPVDRHPDGRV